MGLGAEGDYTGSRCLGYALYAAFGQVTSELLGVQLVDLEPPAGLQICFRITRTYTMKQSACHLPFH